MVRCGAARFRLVEVRVCVGGDTACNHWFVGPTLICGLGGSEFKLLYGTKKQADGATRSNLASQGQGKAGQSKAR